MNVPVYRAGRYYDEVEYDMRLRKYFSLSLKYPPKGSYVRTPGPQMLTLSQEVAEPLGGETWLVADLY